MMTHSENHRAHRIGWLRAAVLGANDGIVSTASLIVGVAAADSSRSSIMIAGLAGLVAGAMSMAAGEYVSVSSQADTERADLDRERGELARDPAHEHQELASIYLGRGLDRDLANQVATQLMANNALGAHARDELGFSDSLSARPIQAALASSVTFAVGAAMPLLLVTMVPLSAIVWTVTGGSLFFLAMLGSLAARAGGSAVLPAAARVTFWGALAMGLTAGVGTLFGTKVG
jgi:VIT1/CCC1 family predicted Fe2+/Mn2+ transporter